VLLTWIPKFGTSPWIHGMGQSCIRLCLKFLVQSDIKSALFHADTVSRAKCRTLFGVFLVHFLNSVQTLPHSYRGMFI